MARKPQAISGVSAGAETEVMTIWPSIAAGGMLGSISRLIGGLMNMLPIPVIGQLKLSHVLFAPIAIGVTLPIYFLSKLVGQKYRITNNAVQIWSNIGQRRFASVPLLDIDEIEIESDSSLDYYNAGDVVLRDGKGTVLQRFPGVVRPDVFRENILKTRDARKFVADSLANINARQTA